MRLSHCRVLIEAAGQSSVCQTRLAFPKLAQQFSISSKMASPGVLPGSVNEVLINGNLYRSVKEGKASILAPYRPDNGKIPKINPQSGAPRNNDEGDQAVFYNPIQQYNRDLSVLAIMVYGEGAIAQKQHSRNSHKRKPRGGKAKQSKQNESTETVQRPSTETPKKRKADEAQIGGEQDEEAQSTKRQRDQQEEVEVEIRGFGMETTKAAAATESATITDTIPIEVPVSKSCQAPFTILDALSASGLRAIRYAKEIPFATTVIANDVSSEAVTAIDLNIKHNDLGGRVFSNVGDARQFMYSKTGNEALIRGPGYVHRFDVIDLDPYGTAASFLDAAIQSVVDGGLLCVTCTDAGVWASNGYPEKTYALYSGIPLKGPHSHEAGLRLILHSIATSAAKYGIAIEPLLCLSIDFYGRLFIRVHKSQQDVKLMAGTTMLVYNCDQGCGAWKTQLMARNQEKEARNGDVYFKHAFTQAPNADKYCEHCGTKTHLGGPMWAGPLHNPVFVQKLLDKIPSLDETVYGTTKRIHGMLTTALEEEDLDWPKTNIQNHTAANGSTIKTGTASNGASTTSTNATSGSIEVTTMVSKSAVIPRLPPQLLSPSPLFFLPTYLAKVLVIPTPKENPLKGAILALGYTCTRSHCKPGSLKTNAPWKVVWETMREWIREHEADRIPRLFGEAEFAGKGSVKKGSAGWNILKRFRGREGRIFEVERMREDLLKKLGYDRSSRPIDTVTDLQAVLKSALYDLEHPQANNTKVATSGVAPAPTIEGNDIVDGSIVAASKTEPAKISGKTLIDRGGDVSELEIIFDAEFARSAGNGSAPKERLVRYQTNPRANWGPMVRAGGGPKVAV